MLTLQGAIVIRVYEFATESGNMNAHTTTAAVETRENHCRTCGKKLGLLKRMSDAEFCDDSHRAAYTRKQNEMGLARLYEAFASID